MTPRFVGLFSQSRWRSVLPYSVRAMASSPQLQFYRRQLPETCISFNSPEGKQVFREALLSGHMEGYFGLAAQFRTQDEPAFCGLSTLVMVLNALEVDPKRVWKGVWRWYHEKMLDCCVSLTVAEKSGITLDQFACIASCNTLTVETYRAEGGVKEEILRETVKDVTTRDDVILVAGYSRPALSQTGSGHFSPVGGYHPERDLVLILDTARFKYPPHWVSLSLLFKAMQEEDPDTGMPRGFILLSKSGRAPLVIFRVSESMSITLQGSDEGGCVSNTMQLFLDTWQEWLSTKPSAEAGDIWDTALHKFMQAVGKLNDDEVLLTTQISVSCPETLSNEHKCLVRDLLTSLESVPLFSMAKDLLGKEKDSDLKKCGQAVGTLPACCASSKATQLQCPYFSVQPAHFVTLLLLAWPHKRCDNTNGLLLRRQAMTQMSKSSLSLQNEVAQLNRQLESLSTYIRICNNMNACRCEGKCA